MGPLELLRKGQIGCPLINTIVTGVTISLYLVNRFFKTDNPYIGHIEISIIRFLAQCGGKEKDGLILKIHPSHTTIAAYVMCSKKTVDRSMKNIKKVIKSYFIIFVRFEHNFINV